MESIIIIEKPDTVSFDEIYEVVYAAHEENRKNGIKVNTRITNGKELKENLGKKFVCYIALDGEKIVGTAFGVIESEEKWCTKNLKIVRLEFFAVLPEYVGRKIGSLLYERIEQYALINEVDIIDLYVVEKNPARNMYLMKGFEEIDYVYRKRLKQNSVYMVKWLKKCKYPIFIRNCYYILKRSYIRIRYKGE